jgi:hypothetical protein
MSVYHLPTSLCVQCHSQLSQNLDDRCRILHFIDAETRYFTPVSLVLIWSKILYFSTLTALLDELVQY